MRGSATELSPIRQVPDGDKRVITLRPLKLTDLWSIAAIHCAAFPKSAITMLGQEAVRRYYEWQMIGPQSICTSGAFIEDKCVGFYLGGVFRESTVGFLNRNSRYLIWQVLIHPWLIVSPLFRDALKRSKTLYWGLTWHKRSKLAEQEPKPDTFDILTLAVHPDFQRLGVGRNLMQHAEDVATNHSFYEMHLKFNPENENALHFCNNLGWVEERLASRWYGDMRKTLS